MNAGSVALPRLRARRRRRRKPPGPLFWWTLFNLLWAAVFLAYDLIMAALHDSVSSAAMAGFMAALLAYWWPLFRREWDRWRKDDGDA